MTRKRRVITSDGYLRCAYCHQMKFIMDFYQIPGAFVCIDDTWYGKPMSYCRQCVPLQKKGVLPDPGLVSDDDIESLVAPKDGSPD